jgi:hypothetical protein
MSFLQNLLTEYVETTGIDATELEKRLDAAKRGLGIANKLKNPIEKKKHLSRILTNLNKIRSALKREIAKQ